MIAYKVLKYTIEYKEKWDAFVDLAKNATFLFKRDFMEYHKDRFEDHSLLVFDKKDNLKAIIPANIVDKTVYSHQGLTYGGVLIQKGIKFSDYTTIIQEVLSFLEKDCVSNFVIKIPPSIYSNKNNEEISAVIHVLEGNLIRSEISLAVNLNNPVGFSSSKRQSISNSKRHDLTIIETDSFSEFWDDVLTPNLENKFNERPVHSLADISLLKKNFPQNLKQFNVYKDKQIIAGVTLFETKNVVHSQYSSGVREFNSLRGLDFLLNFLITERYKHKEYFSFGTSTQNNKLQINQGLFSWKQSFGSDIILQETYSLSTKNSQKLKTLFI